MKNVVFILSLVLISLSAIAQNHDIVREEYFTNGSIKLQFVEISKGLVKATYFHENGKIAQQGFFRNENLYGYWETFDVEHNKIASGFFNENVKTGTWNYWKNGELFQIVSYSNNSMVAMK